MGYVPRWRRVKVTVSGLRRTAFSPIQGRMVVYFKAQALQTADNVGYDMNLLKTAYNNELASQGVDASVASCKQILRTTHSNIITDLWVSSEVAEARLGAVVALIILILKVVAVTAAGVVLLNAGASFIEALLPKPKFIAPDGTEFTDLAAYITYMQNIWNPSEGYPFTCQYCGQGFQTAGERDAHQETCPWKAGVPGADNVWMLVLLALGLVAAIVIVPKIIGAVRGR